LYSELLQDSYLTRNVSHLSGIITLGNLKLNIELAFRSISVLLFINLTEKRRFIEVKLLCGINTERSGKIIDAKVAQVGSLQ